MLVAAAGAEQLGYEPTQHDEWSSPPQLYSLRGGVFRDPREWIGGLKFNRGLEPEVLISAAARPVVGKEEVRRRLEGYLDGASFVLDQTLRGILDGKGPDELRHLVRLPDYLREVPNNLESYGEVSSYTPAIHYQSVGWYDNDAPISSRSRRWTRHSASSL